MAVVITLSNVSTPGPTVLLVMSGLNTTAATLTVERVWAGTTEFLRDANSTYPSDGAAVVRDYEPPLGREATYRVITYTSAGAVLDSVLSGAITAPDPTDPSVAWIMDDLDPLHAMPIVLLKGSEPASFGSSVGLSYPLLALLPTANTSARNQRSQPLNLDIRSRAEAEAFEAMIDFGGVLSIRPSSVSLPHRTGVVRVAAANIERASYQTWDGDARYTADGVEVAPCAWPLSIPWAEWDDMSEDLPGVTWVAYRDANPGNTWIDLMAQGW